jgi:hypothetical protein
MLTSHPQTRDRCRSCGVDLPAWLPANLGTTSFTSVGNEADLIQRVEPTRFPIYVKVIMPRAAPLC